MCIHNTQYATLILILTRPQTSLLSQIGGRINTLPHLTMQTSHGLNIVSRLRHQEQHTALDNGHEPITGFDA